MNENWQPLNPSLYNGLVAAFGSVKVERVGQRYVGQPGYYRGKLTSQALAWGETYRACCPICGDDGYHLYVSHAFGQIDPKTQQPILLAHCYKHTGSVVALINRSVQPVLGRKPVPQKYAGTGVVVEQKFRSPGHCLRVDEQRAETLQSREYLQSRGIDPDWAGKTYGVSHCVVGNPEVYRGAMAGRIILPVTYKTQPVGWQGRLLFTPPKGATGLENVRYMSMPGVWKSKYLVGMDQALAFPYVVVVEGPFDMLKHGPPFVATCGISMSMEQCDRLAEGWGEPGKSIILLGDSDAHDKTLQNAVKVKAVARSAVYAPLLPHGDPGDWNQDDLKRWLIEQVAKGEFNGGTRSIFAR